ncbi:MAG: phosphatidylglycerophosphatase A family protein [bacterium]
MRPSLQANLLPRLIATVGFIGHSPLAPGTLGSLAAALVFLLFPPYISAWFWLAGLALLFVVAVWSAQQMADLAAQGAAPGKVDPQEVVIDEVMGMAVTLAFLPLSLKAIGIGFLLFRIFDIIKPFPVRRSEKLPGGWGIVMDDVIAGIYANVGVRIILSFWPSTWS